MDIDKIKKELDKVEKNVANAIISEIAKLRKEKQELLEVLKDVQKWEAKLIKNDECWQGNKGLPKFNQKLYDDWIKLQSKINKKITQKYEEGENE